MMYKSAGCTKVKHLKSQGPPVHDSITQMTTVISINNFLSEPSSFKISKEVNSPHPSQFQVR